MRFHLTAALAALLIDTTFAQSPADLANFWDYGRSPPVYPTPQGTGTGDWAAAYSQARAMVARMTNEEKQNLTFGVTSNTGCSGTSGSAPRVGFPGMCLNDAGNGPRGMEGASGYPSGVHVGASWNRGLALARGSYMGAEFKAKGVNMALGPVVGPLGRVARGGRNWEGASNDPYLAGQLVYETVVGMQESVIACTKHFILNEQETTRNPNSRNNPSILNVSLSSNIDDKTMHEVYLWPFQDAVRAGTGAVMCSYNRINDSYACANSKTLNGLLKTELGFQGLVVSDWYAQHTGIASANAGLDMVMPSSPLWSGNLTLAVANGSMAQTRLDDMATRILATWYHYAPFGNPGFGVAKTFTVPHTFVNARNPASASTIFQGAMEGHVLVKNVKNALPLDAPNFLSLFGYDAIAPGRNNPTSTRWAFQYENLNITDAQVLNVFGITPPLVPVQAAYEGVLSTGGGSGANSPPYIDAPYGAFVDQARTDNTWLAWDFYSQNPVVDQASSACIVFVNEYATEGQDRPGLADPYSDTLINNVASQCGNTIVVIHNAGIRLVDAFYVNPNVTAIIYAHLPGQDTGRSLVQLMYGQQSFSGRLPYTVAKQASDYGTLLDPTVPDATSNYYPQSNFTEGIYIDYKSFIKRSITPRFAFGYGLTYTTFKYSALAISSPTQNLTALPPASAPLSGGNPNLFAKLATVTATIANTGKVAAMEVPQLYVGIPGSAPKQLRGFDKVFVNPGMSVQVSFALTRRDLSVWDVVSQEWRLQSGTYQVKVGKSALDIQLTGSFVLLTS